MELAQAPVLRRGRKLLPDTMRVWRFVRDAGGWWTQSELVDALSMPACDVCKARHSLMRHDYVASRKQNMRSPRPGQRRDALLIGVTRACRVPNGETLAPAPLTVLQGGATP